MRAVPCFFWQFLWQKFGGDLGLQETIQRNHEREWSRDLYLPQSVQELELHQLESWKIVSQIQISHVDAFNLVHTFLNTARWTSLQDVFLAPYKQPRRPCPSEP